MDLLANNELELHNFGLKSFFTNKALTMIVNHVCKLLFDPDPIY